MKILAIDDVRDFADAWLIARTYKMGIIALRDFGPWTELRLDHDLGGVHQDYHDGKEMTGYDICMFLEENLSLRPKTVLIVTANPVGKKKMEAALEAMSYAYNKATLLWELETEE